MKKNKSGPKILVFDVETAPIEAFVWGIWDQNVGLSMIKKDWHILSWSAKWLGDPPSKVMYMDQRNKKDITDDKALCQAIWELLDEADIVITQNGKSFDVKKLNARFVMHGFEPPSSYRHLDTKRIASRTFAFTSNKLEYMTDKLNKKYKKLSHKEFPGFSMWEQCMKGNKKAWKAMEKYNKYDVLSLEELYLNLAKWDTSINFSVYTDTEDIVCACGSRHFRNKGFNYTNTGKFARFKCLDCGRPHTSKINLFSKEKKQSLKV